MRLEYNSKVRRMEGTDGTLCSFSERGYQCKNTATMDLHDKRWCRIHYERRMRKTLAQKQNRKRKRESSKVMFGKNDGLVRSLGQQVNATTVGVTAQRSVEQSSSVSTEASVKHSTIDKNTISEKTSFNQDGSIKSVKRDVVNETEIATKEKYRVVMSQGFKITEIEKFSATNAKLTSSTPLVTFATHSPLLDDDDIFVLDEHQMERVEYHLKGLTETLGFATFAEMEAASCEEVVRRAWSNWGPFSHEMMDARVIAYVPFFVFYAHVCGRALVGPGAPPGMIRAAKVFGPPMAKRSGRVASLGVSTKWPTMSERATSSRITSKNYSTMRIRADRGSLWMQPNGSAWPGHWSLSSMASVTMDPNWRSNRKRNAR